MENNKNVTDKESALLQATLDLVIENGFHDAPMSKIAKLAGVSVGTIYLYFKSKQDLVNKLYLIVKGNFAEKIFEGFTADGEVETLFKTIWYNIANYKFNNYKEARFLSLCDNTPMIEEHIRQKGLQHLKPLLLLWERGIKEGVVKNISPYLLYAYTVYPINFLIYVNQMGEYNADKKQLDDAFFITWEGIRNKKH